MKRAEALETLGLTNCATALTPEIVQQAFRGKVKATHPDTSKGGIPEDAGIAVSRLKAAKVFLMKNLTADDDLACVLCRGRGIVPQGMGWLPCGSCKGTGVRQ